MALVCLCRGNFYWPPHTTILFCSIFLDKIVLDTLKSRYHRSAPLGIPYILMNAALPVYLCRYSDRGAEPLWFAAVHWGLIFLSGLLVLIAVAAGAGEAGLGGFLAFVFALLTAPLFPFYALFPWAAPVAVCVYAGLLTFFFVRGLYQTKHPRQQ